MSTSLIKYLGEIPRRLIYLVIIILLVFATMFPLKVPMTISDSTRKVYETIDALKPGDIVLCQGANAFMWMVECSGAVVAVVNHLATKEGVKLIILPMSPEQGYFMEYCLSLSEYPKSKIYGEDWAFLDYLPGMDPALDAFLNDVHKTVSVDWYGTPIDELPVMNLIKDHHDIDVFISVGSGPYQAIYFVNAKNPNIIILDLDQASWYSYVVMYIKTGQIYGATNGPRGAGEYERLLGQSGLGTSMTDAVSLTTALIIILLIIGNIHDAIIKRGKVVPK